MKIYRFGNCFLDTVERRVFKNNRSIQMTARTFDVLQLLVQNTGSVVTKDDLIRRVWHGSFVEEGNIAVHISKLRKLLGATSEEPFIETVTGVGYHFVSRVEEVSQSDWKRYLSRNGKPEKPESLQNEKLDSIAILPFQNDSQNKEVEYLAEGLTESVINDLSYIPEIKVMARNTVFRFKDSSMDAQEIGVMLGVTAVLTGRVKIINENIVISTELMKVSSGTQLWGKQFNQPFSDIFEIQEKIAHSISEILRVQISDLAKRSVQGQMPHNVKAYTLYLKGRHFWAKRNINDINTAIKYFQESIATDPSYIASYIGLADCYVNLYTLQHLSRRNALSLVNPILERINEFDKNSPETLEMMGYFKLLFEKDWKTAEECFQKSITLNPNNTIVQFKYAHLLALRGRFAESLVQLQVALSLDPLSIVINTAMGRVFLFMEQFDNAISKFQETLELDTKNYLTLLLLGIALSTKERYEEALNIFYTAQKDLNTIEILSLIGYTLALADRKAEAYEILQQIENQSETNDLEPTNLAYIFIALNENERAFEFLEKAFDQGSPDLLAIKVDPRLKPLRGDSRFQNLVLRIGLE